MKTLILTNGSRTTADKKDEITMLNYFKGNFKIVSNLEKQLKEYSEVETFIISEEFGWVKGDSKLEDVQKYSYEDKKLNMEILEKLDKADVVIILLPREKFQSLIIENWNDIIQKAKNNSIWCLSASSYVLQSIQTKDLEDKKIKLIIYERKGVVRLGNNEKRELIKEVKSKN